MRSVATEGLELNGLRCRVNGGKVDSKRRQNVIGVTRRISIQGTSVPRSHQIGLTFGRSPR